MSQLNKDAQLTELRHYLSTLRKVDYTNEEATHTKMGEDDIDGGRGSYVVPEDKSIAFQELIAKCITANIRMSITELPIKESGISMVKGDLDFRFDVSKKDKIRNGHLFFQELRNIAETYVNVYDKYLNLPTEKNSECHLFLRKSYYQDGDVLKDGLHVMFPYLFTTYDIQFFLRDKLMEELKPILDGLGNKEDHTINDIVDEAVIKRNPWIMYGCIKPNREPYRIYRIYKKANGKVIEDISRDNDARMVQLYSIRRKPIKEAHIITLRDEYVEEFKQWQTGNKEQVKKSAKTIKVREETGEVIAKIEQPLNTISFEDATQLFKVLDKKRFIDTNSWLASGSILYNEYRTQEAFNLWNELSKVYSEYKDGECRNKWNSGILGQYQGYMRTAMKWLEEEINDLSGGAVKEVKQEMYNKLVEVFNNRGSKLPTKIYLGGDDDDDEPETKPVRPKLALKAEPKKTRINQEYIINTFMGVKKDKKSNGTTVEETYIKDEAGLIKYLNQYLAIHHHSSDVIEMYYDFDPNDENAKRYNKFKTTNFYSTYTNVKPAMKLWYGSKDARRVYGMQFIPYTLYPPKDTILNLFTGFKHEVPTIEELNRLDYFNNPPDTIKPMLDHILYVVCSGIKEEFDYIVKYLGRKAQRPSEKNEASMVFATKEHGTGKNTVIEYLKKYVFGSDFVITYGDPLQFLNNFNSRLETAIMVCLDEATAQGAGVYKAKGDGNGIQEKLKNFITSTSFQIEKKFNDAYEAKNNIDLVFTTNGECVFKLEEGDRRQFIPTFSSSRCQDDEYFTRLHKVCDNDRSGKDFFYYLLSVPVGEWRASPPLYTQKKREMMEKVREYSNPILSFLVNHIKTIKKDTKDLTKPIPWIKDDLYEKYQDSVFSARKSFDDGNFSKKLYECLSLRTENDKTNNLKKEIKKFRTNQNETKIGFMLSVEDIIKRIINKTKDKGIFSDENDDEADEDYEVIDI